MLLLKEKAVKSSLVLPFRGFLFLSLRQAKVESFCLPQREAYFYRGTFYFLCRGKMFTLVAEVFI